MTVIDSLRGSVPLPRASASAGLADSVASVGVRALAPDDAARSTELRRARQPLFRLLRRRGAPAAVQAQCQSYGNRTEEIGLAGVEAVKSALELLGAAARQFRRMSQNLQSDCAVRPERRSVRADPSAINLSTGHAVGR